jgi:hypothetical protein
MSNKHTVDIDKLIRTTFKEKNGLVPFFSRSSRRFIEDYFEYWFMKHFPMKLRKVSHSLLRDLLSKAEYFDNELFHLVFQAFVYAETKFIQNYIPQNSHEERLTGHLISEYANSLSIIKNSFEEKAKLIYDEPLTIDFLYTDLSSNNNEKKTGADFGIIFHLNLPDYPNETRAAVFQAKKFKNNFLVDIAQCETLKTYAEEGANYCLYDMEKVQTSSPLVISANRISLPDVQKQSTKSFTREDVFKNWDGGVPLSIFLVFNMLIDETNKNGYKTFDSIWKAKNYLTESNFKENQPSKILVASIGGLRTANEDLNDLNQLFNFPTFEE